MSSDPQQSRRVGTNDFEPEKHFYPRALNAQLNPLVRYFLSLGNARVARRYAHLHPEAPEEHIEHLLGARPVHFSWAGCDLFHTTDDHGRRGMVVVETNSCPSGQKSMPFFDDDERGGYRRLMERAFAPVLKRRGLPKGELAVLFDKNEMEASGYAAALAELADEDVHLVPFPIGGQGARFTEDGVLEVDVEGSWTPIRAALRYVTQRPWERIPPVTKTAIFNPVLACLAGGRNKLTAAKAYDLYNAELQSYGLSVNTPETIWDVARDEVPLWVQRMGGIAVVKNPYSNAGQGVWTITSPAELEAFMELDQRYGQLIVQALIGNSGWSSRASRGRLYHVGTVPDRKGRLYAADLRVMVGAGEDGFFPVAMYARRARSPLAAVLDGGERSWEMLGTNLSVKTADGWHSESERLLLMDNRDYNKLGLGLDDLVEAYVQTVLAVLAIDRLAQNLVTRKGRFRRKLFRSLNADDALMDEIL